MYFSKFFKFFPPPKYMNMRHAGLEISDDAVRVLKYSLSSRGRRIEKFSSSNIEEHIVEGGDIINDKSFSNFFKEFSKANDLNYVKISVPEEKAYLFQLNVPDESLKSIAQNIEFKLEENVPLSANDAVFYFDVLPIAVTKGTLQASVSVVPRAYIEHTIQLMRGVGVCPVSFEVVPKAIARAIIPPNTESTIMIIHIMNKKTGVYIVSGGVVCFTSTVAWGSHMINSNTQSDLSLLTKELSRIHTYWMSHGAVNSPIEKAVLLGSGVLQYENAIRDALSVANLTASVANVWENSFTLDDYVPPIDREKSLDFAVVAGLAMEL